ncbi:hypothetical protein Tco_1079687 [Tanacetum coccineum]|uniref:Uncharacterized protein n=1 Tax=Tanacetum coccineum TaxID=301880 RepID=A0ABQ5HSK4_9ASTR
MVAICMSLGVGSMRGGGFREDWQLGQSQSELAVKIGVQNSRRAADEPPGWNFQLVLGNAKRLKMPFGKSMENKFGNLLHMIWFSGTLMFLVGKKLKGAGMIRVTQCQPYTTREPGQTKEVACDIIRENSWWSQQGATIKSNPYYDQSHLRFSYLNLEQGSRIVHENKELHEKKKLHHQEREELQKKVSNISKMDKNKAKLDKTELEIGRV